MRKNKEHSLSNYTSAQKENAESTKQFISTLKPFENFNPSSLVCHSIFIIH